MDAERLRLQELVNWLGGGKGELLLGFKLRHDVVVIGVEPLGHLHGRDGAGLLLVMEDAAGHDEIGTQINVWPLPVIAFGDGTNHRDGIENMVVEEKSLEGIWARPRCCWSCQCCVRSVAACSSRSVSLLLPDQNCSSACLSSRLL